MSNQDNGGKAFPCDVSGGMTLRDYFAARANDDDITGFWLTAPCEQLIERSNGDKEIVFAPKRRTREEAKYAYADAMLKARGA